MNKYIKGKGIYIGTFNEAELIAKKDQEAIDKAKKATGLKYFNTEIISKKGINVGLSFYMCTIEDLKITI